MDSWPVPLVFAAGGALGALLVLITGRGPLVPRLMMREAVEDARRDGFECGVRFAVAWIDKEQRRLKGEAS